MMGDGDPDRNVEEGVLTSLRYYDEERKKATSLERLEGSNVDHFTTSDNERISLCHLSTILPFTQGNFRPIQNVHEDLVAIALAAHHLNTGDGSISKEVEGLNERCSVRFTTEFADTEFSPGVVLNHVVLQANREPNAPDQRIPCAFIGASRSANSIPMSIVTGLFGYPQVSGSSTSVDLDDVAQFPLFGRTIPSDQGNAVPIIIYMSNVLDIKHLSVINVNDAYGNAYVEGLRLAASIHAPDMVIHQIPLDEGRSSIEAAIQSVKKVKYRFIFCIVFTAETHDQLLTEGFRQGVAGDGLHNWLFADSFAGELDGRIFPKNGPLHRAYTGVGLLEASGGVTGIPSYDNFVSKFPELRNPTDLDYIGSLFPAHDHPNYPEKAPFVDNDDFLVPPIVSGFAPFYYEAAISLGLAACAASEQNESFTGREHYDSMLQLEATGVAGTVKFDPITGTRDPSSVLYQVNNFRWEDIIDPDTGNPGVTFKPTLTDLFQDNQWNKQTDYIFNDGTSNLPADLPPVIEEEPNLVLFIGVPVILFVFLIAAIYLYVQHVRSKNDTVWKVRKEELKFADPPVIIGRGTFGLVLQAEYRGTQVAVKRVIPQRGAGDDSHTNDSDDPMNKFPADNNMGMTSAAASASGMSSGVNLGMKSGSGGHEGGYRSGFKTGVFKSGSGRGGDGSDNKNIGFMSTMATTMMDNRNQGKLRKKLREEFIEEMRYLSKLRHPCVTTVMGAVIGKGEEPMLVMEYMEHGSFYDLLHNETMVIEGELLLPLLRDVSQGVRFLHSADPQVIHGDLKAANILVDTRFRAKVADFGLSQKKNLGGTGTPFWMAPELLRGESINTAASDVFSFGIILYEVYSRRDPYEGEDPREVLRLVADKGIRKRPPVPLGMPDQVKALMSDCVEEDTDKRPTFEELDMRLKRVDAENADPGFIGSVKPSNLSLFDIFPRHVAEALRDGRTVEPENRECVTIFFSDIVGFTNISSTLEPRKVAAMLGRLYTCFDELSQKHDVFKVETIGDAYMAVTNLVKDQPDDHAKRIALFSIDALAAANEILVDEDDPDKGVVNIRVGFHSGPVVADVVGTRNPRYCLFGDTVNTASRMESNSKVNRIHCSRAAAKVLHKQCPELHLKSRGKIPIKGKGEMQTFWVNEDMERRSTLMKNLESSRVLRLSDQSSQSKRIASGLETIIDVLDESCRSATSAEFLSSTDLGSFQSGELTAPESAKRRPSATANKMDVVHEDNNYEPLQPTPFSETDAPGEMSVRDAETIIRSVVSRGVGEWDTSEQEGSGELSLHDPETIIRSSVSHWINATDKVASDEEVEAPESAPVY